jgi:hypothetical protein
MIIDILLSLGSSFIQDALWREILMLLHFGLGQMA